MKNVLVTGSNGFIGRHIVAELKKLSNIELFTITRQMYGSTPNNVFCDIVNKEHVKCAMDWAKPDTVFHLAGNPNVRAGDKELLESNLLGTINVCKFAPTNCHIIFASSAAVYGDNCNVLEPTSTYGITKLAGEQYLFNGRKDIRPLALRYIANVGEGATHGLIKDIITKLMSDSVELELLGDEPGSRKPFMWVKDTARLSVELARSGVFGHTANITTNNTITVKDVAEIVMSTIGIRKNIKWLGDKAVWHGDNKYVYIRGDDMKAFNLRPHCTTSELAIQQGALELYKELTKC